MSRFFRTLAGPIALALGLVLFTPPTPAQASNTWDAIGMPITGSTSSESGTSVATSADGSIVAVGSPATLLAGPGKVAVYQLVSDTWTQMGADIVGAANGDRTGWSVALSSDGLTMAVGSPYVDPPSKSNGGVVHVYRFQSGAWGLLGSSLPGTSSSEFVGFAVSLSANGNRIAVGAPGASSRGAVSVFDYTAGTNSWAQVGSTLVAEAAQDYFGHSVALSDDGSWLAVGAPKNDVGGSLFVDRGHARVFELVATTWTQRGADIDGEVAGDLAGQSIALSANGQRLVIGSPNSDVAATNAGRARVFDYTGSAWTVVGSALNGVVAESNSGWAVDINSAGDQIAVGARNSDVPATDAGSVTAFTLISGTWTQRGQTITGTAASEQAGYAVAMSAAGDRIVIGAPGRALPSADTGEVRVFGFTAARSPASEASPGLPGIYLHIPGPVGRSTLDSPIYVGSDRVAPASAYTLSINPDVGQASTLATGRTDTKGNLGLRITLPALAPGDYVITFTGRHASGTGLKLATTIRVGAGGNYVLIGENRPGVW